MLEIILYTAICGVIGTGLGGCIGVILPRKNSRILIALMSLSGGIMISISMLELLPTAISMGGLLICVPAFILGSLLIAFFSDKLVVNNSKVNKSSYIKVGLMISLAIAMHNFPEGLVIGSSSHIDSPLKLAIIISLHNIPEGMAMSLPLVKGGSKKSSAIIISLLSGLPTVLGGIIGYIVGGISPYVIATCYALASGTMLFICFDDVFRYVYSGSESKIIPLYSLIGIGLGAIVSFV